MELQVPEFALVLLIGISGSGKSTFARRHFAPTEVLSSDAFRAMIVDDENDQSVSVEAFEALYVIARQRLAHRRLTVVDATNVQPKARQSLLRIAKEHDVLAVAIVFDVPESVAQARNAVRTDRDLPDHVVPRQRRELHRGLRGLGREFKRSYVMRTVEEIDAAFATFAERRVDAVCGMTHVLFFGNRERVIGAAARWRLPTIYPFIQYTQSGGLVSYGSSVAERTYQVGIYVGLILNGQKPADLPVRRLTKFELAINMTTAKALGLTVPARFLALTDKVIE
jgi:predicted kinase